MRCRGSPDEGIVTMSRFMINLTGDAEKKISSQSSPNLRLQQLLTGLDECLIVALRVLFLEKRIPVELDHLISDTTLAERLADGLGYEDNDLRRSRSTTGPAHDDHRTYHGRKDIIESTCKLKHDDDDGNGHAGDATEGSRCAEKSIGSRRDAGNVRRANAAEPGGVRVCAMTRHLQPQFGTMEGGA